MEVSIYGKFLTDVRAEFKGLLKMRLIGDLDIGISCILLNYPGGIYEKDKCEFGFCLIFNLLFNFGIFYFFVCI